MVNKLSKLRELLGKNGIDAYLQPVHDEWMSEYPPACNRRVEWLCSFSGSAGLVVVTASKAAIFVDGRYTLQAAKQVSADYEVFNSADTSVQDWTSKQLGAGAKIGYDPKLYTKAMLDKLTCHPALVAGSGAKTTDINCDPRPRNKCGVTIIIPTPNLIDELWEDRPPAPATKIFAHDIKYSGESSQSKRGRVAEAVKKAGADAAFLSAAESVNWLLNIRARDTENTPICLVNALIDSCGNVQLYVDGARIDEKTRSHLGDIKILPPDSLAGEIRAFSQKKLLLDSQTSSVFISNLCEEAGVKIVQGQDPCVLFKAVKNPIEIAGIRSSHIIDGVAVVKLLCWLGGQENISELEVVDKILEFRKRNDLFVEPSFDTIAGSGEHGAIVHYRATQESNRILQQGELFLLDSGGQYQSGTTDITRTIAIGKPSAEHKKRFTQVLKGHIALAMAIFPEGTQGSQLDALARQYLWQDYVDYDHGTGHGVGCFLGVHEGPQSISKRAGGAALAAGMVVSNEPGYYKAGEYGIRIENLVTVVEKTTGEIKEGFGGKKFLGFETLTCVPIDASLIDILLLTEAEINWLNNYHDWVKTELSPLLDAQEREWLDKFTTPLK